MPAVVVLLRGVSVVPRRLAVVLAGLLAAFVLVPLASGGVDGPSRSAACNSQYMPSCTIAFTVVPVSGVAPASNPPHLGGSAEWKITANPAFGDTCSGILVSVQITGPNTGQSVSQSTQGN